jgi:hypothetical protein
LKRYDDFFLQLQEVLLDDFKKLLLDFKGSKLVEVEQARTEDS